MEWRKKTEEEELVAKIDTRLVKRKQTNKKKEKNEK